MGAEPVKRRGFGGCLVRVLLGLLVGVILISLGGAVYQSAATAADLRAYPPPGKLVDVGGYRLHIHCQGEGSPAVIFESGLGSSGAVWALVQPEVAGFTRACAYDRAGMGWSEPGPQPRDSQAVAGELKRLLEGASVPGPYVLVGNSFGGLYARAFAAAYPDEVAGLVLVDASHEDMMARFPTDASLALKRGQDVFFSGCRYLYPLGAARLLGSGDPSSPLAAERVLSMHTKSCQAMAGEYAAVQATNEQVRASGGLGSLPLIVLTRSVGAAEGGGSLPGVSPEQMRQMDAVWQQLQKEMVGLSSQSEQRIVPDSGHLIQIDQPQAVVEAIREMVE